MSRRSKEGDVLRDMAATLNRTITAESDPIRFGDVMSSAGLIAEQAAMNVTSMAISEYDKVRRITSAVMSHITNQASPEVVTQRFDKFVLVLYDQLKLDDLATKLAEKLCAVKHGYRSPILDDSSTLKSGAVGTSTGRASMTFPSQGEDISSLSCAARGDLRQQLQANLKAIQESFADYVDCIQELLIAKRVELGRLKSYLIRLPCGCGDQNLMLLSAKKDDIKEAADVYEIFMTLDDFTSFLDYYIFEKIVIQFEIDSGQEHLKYPEKLQKYIKKHTISEFIEVHPVLNNYTDGTKKLVLILDVRLTSKFSKLVDVGHSVAQLMNLDQSALLIHNVGERCVIVTFLIPSFAADAIFAGQQMCIFSADQEEKFRNLSVQELHCNGYHFDFASEVRDTHSELEGAGTTTAGRDEESDHSRITIPTDIAFSSSSGPEVVELCIEVITSSTLNLPDDNHFMKRVAYVMSGFGRALPGSGGIWQLSRTAFEDTMDTVSHDGLLPIKLKKIKEVFEIDWRSVQYHELDKPFYSALAARLYLSNHPEYIPPEHQVREQAEYWNSKYMMGKGDIHIFEQKVLSMA